jgi:hypothetical protein
MAHQEGQREELVVSQAEQEALEEELLETVTGGAGLRDFFRGCVRCFNPQTQETPGSPHAQQTPAGPSAQQTPVSGGTGVWLSAERRFLTQAEFNAAYISPSPQPHPGTSSLGSSSSATSSTSNHSVRLEPR